MKVKFLMIAEVEVPEGTSLESALPEAQSILDNFREAAQPSNDHGITLYRVRADDPELRDEPDILRDGVAIKE